MFLSLPITSLSATTQSDSLIWMPRYIAEKVVLDLEHYDYIIIENDSLRANIADQERIIIQKDTKLEASEIIIGTLESKVNTTQAESALLKAENVTLKLKIKELKKQRNVFAVSSIVTAALLILALL